MIEFSLWDIFRNLLLAARWTVALSLIAFVGGGLVGLALLVVRLGPALWAQRAVAGYVQLFQGTPLLMQLFLAYFGIALFGINTSLVPKDLRRAVISTMGRLIASSFPVLSRRS